MSKKKPVLMQLASESEINIIRGKHLGHAVTKEDIDTLLAHILALEHVLDEEANPEDMFGTEGWRHHFACVIRDFVG
jgi:hypothetical protein